jgi:hypothetical protein
MLMGFSMGMLKWFAISESGCSKKVIPLFSLMLGFEAVSVRVIQIKTIKTGRGRSRRRKKIETLLCVSVGIASH